MLKKMWKSPLWSGSVLLVSASLLVAVGNYAYQFIAGRALGTKTYGEFASLTSVFLILSVFSGTLQMMVVRMVSAYKAHDRLERVERLRQWLSRVFWGVGILSAIGFYVLAEPISRWLNVSDVRATQGLAGILLFFFLLSTHRGVIHGLQRFGHLSGNILSEVGVKLIAAVILFGMGFRVAGFMGAQVVGIIVAYFLSFLALRGLPHDEQSDDLKFSPRHVIFASRMLLVSLGLTLLLSSDILFVNHYFPGDPSGQYSAAANLGRIIVFGTASIAQVLLPLASERFDRKEDPGALLRTSWVLSAFAGIFATAVYAAWPRFWVSLFYGSKYDTADQFLTGVAVAMTLYALVNLLATYYISIQRWGFLVLILVAVAAQAVGFLFWHESIHQLITVMIAVEALLLTTLMIVGKKILWHKATPI